MKRLLLLFLFSAFSINLAYAVVYTKPTLWHNTVGQTTYIPGDTRFFSNPDAACKSYYDTNYRQFPYLGQRLRYDSGMDFSGSCLITIRNSNGVPQEISAPVVVAYQCPTGFTFQQQAGGFSAQRCAAPSCPANTTVNPVTNSCDDNCLPNKDKVAETSMNCASSEPSSICMPNNCAANVNAAFSVRLNGCFFGAISGRYTGATCTGQPSSSSLSNPSNANPPPSDSPETDCIKQGKTVGYVNGVPVCVPKGSASGAPVKQTDTSTTTTTNTDTKGNSQTSSSSEVKNATQDGDQVTSTTTKTNADGTKTEETKTESTTSFCATNPTHPICKKAAQEEEEGPDPCEDNPDLPQCIGLGEAEEGGAIATSNKTVSFAPVQITSGGSCPPDKSVSIAGRSITFSYSWLCQYASMFKPFMLAFAYLSAAMFLFMGLRGANT